MTRRSLVAAGAAALALALRPRLLFAAPKNVCSLTCAQPPGPCHSVALTVRRDIAAGRSGLPALLSFQIVDADTCRPLEGALVDVWHLDANGLDDAARANACDSYVGGRQSSDAGGWVNFESVFPGWVRGRTTHVNVTIRIANEAVLTTQFYFDDKLTDLVYSRYPPYSSRPPRDTTSATDPVLGANPSRLEPYLLSAKLVLEKAVAATKIIGVRNSSTCLA